MPSTHEIAAYAQRLIREYNRARKLLRKYFKKRHDPDEAHVKIKEIIDNMTAKQSKIIGYTLNDAFRKSAKEGDREISNATISAAASSASMGFDLTKVANTHLKNITQSNIGHIGKYNSVLTNQLQLEYNTLLADNKLVDSLDKHGWTPWLDKALAKRGVKPEVIALAKGQTTTKKIIDILEMEGIRGGRHPREVSKMLLPHIQRHFGPEGVVIDNVGKFRKVLKVDADGNFKYVKQAVTRSYRATHKSYSNLLARTSMIQAHHEGRYQSLQKTGLVDHYISESVLDANTCDHCAMMHGQRVSKAEGPLYHPSCACDRKPIWKKDSGLKNKDPAIYEKQRDQHFWKQHQLAEYNKNMPKGAKLKFHSMLPKDALVDMPGKEAMRTIRYNALGKPTAITPKILKQKILKVKPKAAEKIKEKVKEKAKEKAKEKVKEKIKEKAKIKIEKVVKKKIKAPKKVKKIKEDVFEDIEEPEIIKKVVKKSKAGKLETEKEKSYILKTDKAGITKRLKMDGVNYIQESNNKLGFTFKEEMAIDSYQGAGYIDINGGLRGKTKITKGLKNTIKSIDSALSKSKVPEDVNVFRGISTKQAKSLKVTNKCSNKGYTSTSYNPESTFPFTARDEGGFFNMIEMKLKKGTNGLMWPGGENEIMLKRGLKLKCTGIKEVANFATKSGKEAMAKTKKVRIFIMEEV